MHRNVAEMDRIFHHMFMTEKMRDDYLMGAQRDLDEELHEMQVEILESQSPMKLGIGIDGRADF